jgi:hypothetical protein
MTSVAKLQNLTTPVEINWSLMNDEKAVFTFECEPEAEEEEEEELCCRDCGGEVGECCCDYGNPELARLRDGDSEEEADQGFSWENMDFGTAENPTCGICGKREDNPYAFDEDGNLVEDVICAKCDSIYVYDEELDSYIQKKQQEEEEYSCENCGHQFKNEEEWAGCCDEHSCVNCECDCSECAEEEEEVRPTHDQLVALGKYKLAKYQIKKHENYCEICDVNKGDDGCDCRIIECARCGEKGPKYNHKLGSDGLLRCDDCFDAPADSCSQCGIELGEDIHIFCFCKGDDETTMCSNCADELTDEMRANGWTRDDDDSDSE